MGDLIKLSDLEIVDPSKFGLRGYASVTGEYIPAFNEVVDPGAFKGVLARTRSLPIKVNHQMELLQIGETTLLQEDDHGFYFEGRAYNTLSAVDALGTVAARGQMDASFSFDYGERSTGRGGITHIKSFKRIHELGPVNEGANPAAYVEIFPLSEASQAIEPAPLPASSEFAGALDRATAQMRSLIHGKATHP